MRLSAELLDIMILLLSGAFCVGLYESNKNKGLTISKPWFRFCSYGAIVIGALRLFVYIWEHVGK